MNLNKSKHGSQFTYQDGSDDPNIQSQEGPRHCGRGARWVEEWKSSSRARKPFLFDWKEKMMKQKPMPSKNI